MYFCGDSVLLNESHWVIICIIRIFGQIFGQNFGIWPPGVPIYMGISYWFAIYFEEIPPSLVLNVFLWWLCIIKWPKLGNYLHNTNIWVHFWSTFGYLTPEVTIYRITPDYHHALFWVYFCRHLAWSNGSNKKVIWIIPIIGVFFVKMGVFYHRNRIYSVTQNVLQFIQTK